LILKMSAYRSNFGRKFSFGSVSRYGLSGPKKVASSAKKSAQKALSFFCHASTEALSLAIICAAIACCEDSAEVLLTASRTRQMTDANRRKWITGSCFLISLLLSKSKDEG